MTKEAAQHLAKLLTVKQRSDIVMLAQIIITAQQPPECPIMTQKAHQ